MEALTSTLMRCTVAQNPHALAAGTSHPAKGCLLLCSGSDSRWQQDVVNGSSAVKALFRFVSLVCWWLILCLSRQMPYLFLAYFLPFDVLNQYVLLIDWEVLWLRLSGAFFFLLCVCCMCVCSMRLIASTFKIQTPFHYLPSEMIVETGTGDTNRSVSRRLQPRPPRVEW